MIVIVIISVVTFGILSQALFPRCCYDTLRGHNSTVWSISFDKTGDQIGKFNFNLLQMFFTINPYFFIKTFFIESSKYH